MNQCINCKHFHNFAKSLRKEYQDKIDKLEAKKLRWIEKSLLGKLFTFDGWSSWDEDRLTRHNQYLKEIDDRGQCWLNPKLRVVGKTYCCSSYERKSNASDDK